MDNSKMGLYRGTKELKAWPMTKAEYVEYRGWEMPTDEDPTEAGYLVEYLDNGKANHLEHSGYVSWSPADVFEHTYYRTDQNTASSGIDPMHEKWRGEDRRRSALDFAVRSISGTSNDFVGSDVMIALAKAYDEYVVGPVEPVEEV